MSDSTTHFGYEQVPVDEKVSRVGAVFSSVASRYDLMNDLMSFGLHRAWKRFAVELANLRPDEQVLDLAGGTGDLAKRMIPKLRGKGSMTLADINASMLAQGRDRLLNEGYAQNLKFVQANAEHLPFASNRFHAVTIAFGLRNVTRPELALREMWRVLKPGGRALVLEFSHPVSAVRPVYDLYSFKVLPAMGRLVARDAASYRYLAESIRMHPDQPTLRDMMASAGFERCEYFNLSAGIVALHRGYKL